VSVTAIDGRTPVGLIYRPQASSGGDYTLGG